MKPLRISLVTCVLIVTMSVPAGVAAQAGLPVAEPVKKSDMSKLGSDAEFTTSHRIQRLTPNSRPDFFTSAKGGRHEDFVSRATVEATTADFQFEYEPWRRPVIRIGQDFTVRAGETIGEVFSAFGDITVDGRVDRDVIVVFGNARLSNTAFVGGSLVVIGGSVIASGTSTVNHDLLVVGGGLDAPASFMPGREHVVIGTSALGGKIEAIVPWITRGLLWGRPIVPDVRWVWGVVGVFFLVYLALNLVFDRPIRTSAGVLAARPLTAFVVGLLVLLLTGPISLLLAVSVIGIAVVPVLLCALVVAGIVGKIATARWIGARVVRSESDSRLQSVGSFTMGFAVITVSYMVPVLGVLTWTLLGVLGLGAAALAFLGEYRRERPAATPPAGPGVTPPPSVMPPIVAYQRADEATPYRAPPTTVLDAPAEPLPPTTASDLSSLPRAAFRDRLAAFVLDIVLLVIAVQVLDVRDEAIAILFFAYFIGFWTWKGATLGGIVCQLRVVRVDGAPFRFADALVRGLSCIFSLVPLGIGCLWILRDPEQQAWHDKIAGTYVVRVPRNWPL